MAAIIYRRLPRVFSQASGLSTSKWAWGKPLGRSNLLKSAKPSAHAKESNLNKLSYQESTVDNLKGIEENDLSPSDNDYPIHVSKTQTKTHTPFLHKPKSLKLDRQKHAQNGLQKSKENSLYDQLETYNNLKDPRAFQQQRPEYTAMCYNSVRLVKTPEEKWEHILAGVSDLTHGKSLTYLEKLSYFPEEQLKDVKNDVRFKMLCNYIIKNVRLYTDCEIISIFSAFVRLEISRLKCFEDEFCMRAMQLSTNHLLLVADTFRYKGLKVPKFLDVMYSCMQLRCSELSLPQVIQLVYIIGEGRQAPQELLEKIEATVLKYLPSINLEEIGTVCLGFFKTGNGLSELLMSRFIKIIIDDIEQISNCTLTSVLKMIRFTRVYHMEFFTRVGRVASKRIPAMATQGIMHVVLAFASMRMLDEDLMNAVALCITDRLSYCRSKDLAKFLWSFGVLRFQPPNSDFFYSVFINQIRENLEEFKSFPEHFLTCLMGLIFCQQFPLDLINIALDKTFYLQSIKVGMFELKKDLFTIAGSVEIECPQYSGNTISPEFRKEVTDLLTQLSTRKIHEKEEVTEAGMVLQQILGGPQYVKEHMILPHLRSKDFEVHLDKQGKPVAINSSVERDRCPKDNKYFKITDSLLNQLTNPSTPTLISSKDRGVMNSEDTNIVDLAITTNSEKNENPACQSEVIKLAIQVTNRNQYLSYSKQLLGLHAMKRRQLQKLGYVVVEIPFWEWFPLAKCKHSQKAAYLRHKVFGSVNSKC